MIGRIGLAVPSTVCGLLVYLAGAPAPMPGGVPQAADCEENGCNAYWDVYSPTHHELSGGSHPTEGHGSCFCEGADCEEYYPCSVTHVFTVDAGESYVYDPWEGSMGHNETFTVYATECDPESHIGEKSIRITEDQLGIVVLESVTLRIYCKKCEDHDGLGCPK